MQLQEISKNILSVLKDGEILLIVPPFGSIEDICLGPHVLQSLAEAHGYKTDILYLNMALASVIGAATYEKIHNAPLFWMFGERLFARSAYDLPSLGHHPEYCADEAMSISGSTKHPQLFYETYPDFDLYEYLKIEHMCKLFLDEVIAAICSMNYNIIGCTALAMQTNCSIAILAAIKKCCPEIITLIGGGSCEGEMAEGVASLSTDIDYVFSSESETAFLKFLEDYSSQKLPPQRILHGEIPGHLDHLPFPDYAIFFHQAAHFLNNSDPTQQRIWYEISRGCWWAQKSKCTFCGIPHVPYRQKSVHTVVNDMQKVKKQYPNNMLFIADNIMPPSYQQELLPILSQKEDFPELAYQLRANLSLQDLIDLKNARIHAILPGMESLSTQLLKSMHKGITGRQSLLFLRNATCVGIYCDWSLLWGLPDDKISDYKKILKILPLIRHLQPPRKFLSIILMRFSPYVEHQHEYNIHNVRLWNVFNMIYPDWADINKLGIYYAGEYSCGAHENPRVIQEIFNEIVVWRNVWKDSKLAMRPFMGAYMIYDNRGIHETAQTHVLNYRQAKEVMISQVYEQSEPQKWAVENKLGVVIDGWYVPLVVAPPDVLLQFENSV